MNKLNKQRITDAYNENIKKQEETRKYITERTSTAISGLKLLVQDPKNATLTEDVKKYIYDNMPTHQDENWIVAREINKNNEIPEDIKKYILSKIGEYNGTLH
jgi:DNA polymerase III delta prime subunit